jgi:hypothetical protein
MCSRTELWIEAGGRIPVATTSAELSAPLVIPTSLPVIYKPR